MLRLLYHAAVWNFTRVNDSQTACRRIMEFEFGSMYKLQGLENSVIKSQTRKLSLLNVTSCSLKLPGRLEFWMVFGFTTHWFNHSYYLFIRLLINLTSRGSSVSTVSDWTAGVRSPTEAEDFSSNFCVQTGSGAHPASCTGGTGGSFPGGKARPGRDADHSPPSSAEVKKE
jgi:hypothetical protein